MFLGGQRDIKRWACVDLGLCKFVEEKIDGREGIPSNHHDARDQLFLIFSNGKTGTRQREHRLYFSSICYMILFIGFLFVMVVIANF